MPIRASASDSSIEAMFLLDAARLVRATEQTLRPVLFFWTVIDRSDFYLRVRPMVKIRIQRFGILWRLLGGQSEKFLVGSAADALLVAIGEVVATATVELGGVTVTVESDCERLLAILAESNARLNPSNPYPVKGNLAINAVLWVASRSGIVFQGEIMAKAKKSEEVVKVGTFSDILKFEYVETAEGIRVESASLLPGIGEFIAQLFGQAVQQAFGKLQKQEGLTMVDDGAADATSEETDDASDYLEQEEEAGQAPRLAAGTQPDEDALDELPFDAPEQESDEDEVDVGDDEELTDADGLAVVDVNDVEEDEVETEEEELDDEGTDLVDEGGPEIIGGEPVEDEVEMVGEEELEIVEPEAAKPSKAEKKPAAKPAAKEATKPTKAKGDKTSGLTEAQQAKLSARLDGLRGKLMTAGDKKLVATLKQTFGDISAYKGMQRRELIQLIVDQQLPKIVEMIKASE